VYTPLKSVTATEALPDWVGLATLVATTVCVPAVLGGAYKPLELIVPTVELPPAMPSTVQVAAPPPGTLAVNCWDCDRVSAAYFGATGKLFPDVMLTTAEAAALPPTPEQVSVKVEAAVSAPVEALPLVPLDPLQPADAVHEVAFVLLQVSVEASPDGTEVGLAVSVTVGFGNTVTVTVAAAGVVPAAPEHVSV
jgi:hypothetical protein